MNVGEEFKLLKDREDLPELNYENKKYLYSSGHFNDTYSIDHLIIKYNKKRDPYYIYRIRFVSIYFIYNIKISIDYENIEDKIIKINLYDNYEKVTSLKLNEKNIFDEKNPFINHDGWIDIVFDCDLIFLYDECPSIKLGYNYLHPNNKLRRTVLNSPAYNYDINGEYIEFKNSDIEKKLTTNFGVLPYKYNTDHIKILVHKLSLINSYTKTNILHHELIVNLYENIIEDVKMYAIDLEMNLECAFSCTIKITFEGDERTIFKYKYMDVNYVQFDAQQIKQMIDNEKITFDDDDRFYMVIETNKKFFRYDINYLQ